MKSAILEKGERYYTYLGKIFGAIKNKQIEYNWLITDYVCYPKNKDLDKLFSQEYIWISGEQLTEAINGEDFQFIWGVFSGFPKDITIEEVLKYDLPFADGNEAFWVDDVIIQHPLADVEIVAWDSSLTLFISKDHNLVQKFMIGFPLSKDLSAQNIKQNAEVAHIEELMIDVLSKRSIYIDNDVLYKKYSIWNKLYYKKDSLVEDKDIKNFIYEIFKLE